jgi:hypothetical protein
MLSPFVIFRGAHKLAASPFMEGMLAGKYGINMEEIRKFLNNEFYIPNDYE